MIGQIPFVIATKGNPGRGTGKASCWPRVFILHKEWW